MATLVLDTALHCAQAALFDSDRCLAQKVRTGDRGQAEILLPLLGDVLHEAKLSWRDISEVVVTVGPGVFTGIRTGLAVARALKLALDIPVVGVGTLHVLSAMAQEKDKSILALIDAHKNEVYAQQFSHDLKALSEPMLLKCDELGTYIKTAEQVIAYPAAFAKMLDGAQFAERLDLQAALKCAALMPLDARPLYVRAPDAQPNRNAQLRRA